MKSHCCKEHDNIQLIGKSQRLKTHNSGKGAKYTRARLPVSLVYYKRVDNKSFGLKLESRIKKLTKKEKEALVKQFNLRK